MSEIFPRNMIRELKVWSLSIDCGKKPGIKAASGNGIRRCRVLLAHPNCTALDFRLLSQVEVCVKVSKRKELITILKLNSIRGKMVLRIEERCGPYTDIHGSTRP